jgi:nitric oxide dioxygenase
MDTDAIPLHLDADVYLCGPVPVRADGPGRPAPPRRAGQRIRYEVFGSEQWRPAPAPTPA